MTTTASPPSSPSAPSADSASAATIVRTPGRGRRAIAWTVIVAAVIGLALLGLQVAATAPAIRSGFDPEVRGPAGAQALAEILRQQGVEVVVTRDRAAAAAAARSGATLAMSDPYALSDDAVRELVDVAGTTVVLTVSSRMLRLLDLGDYGSGGPEMADASCSLPEFARVGRIDPGQQLTPASGVTACFGDDGTGAVLVSDDDGRRRTIVDGSRLLSNEHLAENGNAALGLALLGQHGKLVWYVPSFEDSDLEGLAPDDTLGSLTPAWVTPAILMLIAAAVAGAVWRGRRFGPLVTESLPVTVRASETMRGRARLTAKAADAPHAAEALRDGVSARLAARLGIALGAGPQTIADAAADRIRATRASVRELLAGPLPQTDPELVAYARALAALETAVDDVVRTERSTP
ncbi:hypothetical protein J2Y69_000947 [Microbacterium resistens]|uniref:DUF4350 domain-containing protein n=1 Tax=Microbacterium resistens TaxID=156977 RepID=A0ABU1S9T5_9MICO|nr:DUF4350 domain-containing protein [Microbacterium resistens]MDR6866355.1 hypothetical protein [Microbacterium resistens]